MKISLGTLYRLFLAQMVLTMLLALPLSNANAQYNAPGYGQNPYGHNSGLLQAQINRTVHGYSQISVIQEIQRVRPEQLRGQQVLQVVLHAFARQGYASAQLLINGMRVGHEQTISSYQNRLIFELSRYSQNVIGQDINSIQIAIQGSAQVQMVALQVEDRYQDGGYGSRVISMQTREYVRGTQRLSLEQLVGYNRALEGRQIEEVTITAQGQGTIIAVARGSQLGSISVGNRSGVQVIRTFGAVMAQDIMLRMTGNMTITNVSVRIARY